MAAPRKAAGAPPAAAAGARGEVTVTLEGVPYATRLTFGAIADIEGELGRGAVELLVAAQRGALSATEIAAIVTHALRAEGRAEGDRTMQAFNQRRVGDLLFEREGGLLHALVSVALPLLSAALTGGYTALGEAKAAKPGTTPAPGSAA